MKNILFYILLFAPICLFSQNTVSKHSPKAVELNKRAFKLLISGWDGNSSTTKEQLNIKILKILDSASRIEPTYTSVQTNKLYPLISLGRYTDAAVIIKSLIKSQPKEWSHYIKAGILYRDYLKQNPNATKYFKTAYNISKTNAVRNKKLQDEQKVNLTIALLHGKKAALEHLNKLSLMYTDSKSKKDISLLRTTLIRSNFSSEENIQFFRQFSTY